MSVRTKDFDYHLPEGLIASRPLADRAASRMLVVDRAAGTVSHRLFREIGGLVQAGDLWVFNDTRVIPARVYSDDGRVELLCLDRPEPLRWRCLAKPGKRMRPGRSVRVAGIEGVVEAVLPDGDRIVRWQREIDLARHGHLALPHYMGREDEESDRERYQTVFARHEGAIAAPTAGLHFTPDLLEKLPHAFLTLHVGVGTFRPVTADDPRDHTMHSERYLVSAETAARVNAAGRVVAVGTTVTRVLEALARANRGPVPGSRIPPGQSAGETDIFLYPPCEFHAVDALLTNFHLPQSTLLMLVCAFAGHALVMEAYRQAVAEKYRFYSYGDCMLVP